MINESTDEMNENGHGGQSFTEITQHLLEDYNKLRQSLYKNILIFRKYRTFIQEDRLPTNLLLKRGYIQYSNAWTEQEKTTLHKSEEAILHTAQQDMMAVRSKAYYDMVLKQGKQIETLLNKNTIRTYFYDKNPELNNNNSNETITREFDNLFQEIDKEFPIMGLTSEEHIEQLKSITTTSNTLKRTRDTIRTEYNSDSDDTTSNKLRSVQLRPVSYSPTIHTSMHSSSSSSNNATSTSSSTSSTTTIPALPHDTPTNSSSPNHNQIKIKKLKKFQKITNNITNNKKSTVSDLLKTSTTTRKPKINNNNSNIKTITDQLSSLSKTVELFISTNNNTKNGKNSNEKVKKKNTTNNIHLTTNTKDIQTKHPYIIKSYNQNKTPLYTPPQFHQIAPALNLQPLHFITQQPHYQHYNIHHPPQSFNNNYNNNNQERYHLNHSIQHINNYENPNYEVKNHPYLFPNHG